MILKKRKKHLYLGSNLDYLLAQHNLDIKNLSQVTAVPPATIARMRRKGSNPTISSLEPLLDFFRVDMDSLLYEDMTSDAYKNKKAVGGLTYIPIVSLEDARRERKQAKVSKIIGAAGIRGQNVFGIQINSDSLAPAFQNNSTVIVDPDLKPVEGDYVLCILGGADEAPVFRQIFIDGKNFYFRPINPGFGEMRHHEKYLIVGVIIKTIESFREN